MHDDIKYYHDPKGNLHGELPEVIITRSRHLSNDGLEVVAGLNTILAGLGISLSKNSGNSTFGSNHSFYWHVASERGFYGNQYVSTFKLASVGKSITKFTGPIGNTIDGISVFNGIVTDVQNYQHGYTNGYNTIRATSNVAGGWAGTTIGATLGAKLGATAGV